MNRFSPWFGFGVCVVFFGFLNLAPIRAEDAPAKINFSTLKDSKEMAPAEMGLKSIEALGVCLIVFCVIVYGLKRTKRFQSGLNRVSMTIKERLALSNKHSLVKVQIGVQEVVLAIGPEGVQQIIISKPKRKRRKGSYDFDQVLSDGSLQLAAQGGE